MKRVKLKKNMKISKVMLIVITLIFFFTSFEYRVYVKNASPNIVKFAKIKLNEFMESFLSDKIGHDILNKNELEDVLIITKNSNGEILFVDYDLDKAYKVLNVVTSTLKESISDLNDGNFNEEKYVLKGNNCLVIKVPFFISSQNILLVNLGPKIYVPVNFVGSILTNIKSKITNYGINNALVELYVTIQINTSLIAPVEEGNIINYNVLVASKIVNGRVPELYGGVISNESSLLSIPLN